MLMQQTDARVAHNCISNLMLGSGTAPIPTMLNYGVTVDDCRKLVELSGADAIVLHFNPLQEALQDEGQTNFAGLLDKVANLCATLGREGIHVMAKEVGWGFSEETCKNLADIGISAIDLSTGENYIHSITNTNRDNQYCMDEISRFINYRP